MTSKAGVTITNGTAKSGVVKMFGFEAFTVYSPTAPWTSYAYRPSSATWSFESYAGVSYNDTDFTASNLPAPEGSQVAFIQGPGRMTATVAGLAGIATG